ncbi:unnamed protein product [Linum trigynum]|uniref:Uncharacterized protein n=1 Tax=Linum trigynum TaxID=586398 RepID=A0AAV2E2P1_9ROSI
MAHSFTPFFLALLFILITTTKVLENVKGDPDLTFISALCGSEYDISSFRKAHRRRRLVRKLPFPVLQRYRRRHKCMVGLHVRNPFLRRTASIVSPLRRTSC